MSRRKNADVSIIPTVSGYGPRVSVGDTAHVELFVVVVVVVVASAAVGDPPHAAMAAAPTLAPSEASASRRSIFLGKDAIPAAGATPMPVEMARTREKNSGDGGGLSYAEVRLSYREKIDFASIAWTPFVPSTSCVT